MEFMTDQMFYTSGAGNSFLLSFNLNHSFEALRGYALAGGYKPDGYILFEDMNDSYFEWKFLNNDGSEVDFCGNALRAVGVCAKKAYGFDEININTLAGMCEVKMISDNQVKAEMPKPSLRKKVVVDGYGETQLIDAGVPHLVFKTPDLNLDVLKKVALKVRGFELEDEAQTLNLSFYMEGSNPVECVTFERGVEDFTLACGSGAMAVAHAHNLDGKNENLKLKMPGGELEVIYEGDKIYMLGSAQIDKVI